jgi:hypothetical protein
MTLAAGCQAAHAQGSLGEDSDRSASRADHKATVEFEAPAVAPVTAQEARTIETGSPRAEEAADGAAKAGVVTGPAATGEGYSVQLQAAGPLKVGQAATLTVSLKALEPFKCNDKYPYKFKFEPNAAVSFQSDVVRGMKIEGKQATLSAPFTPKAAGKQTVSGELSFSVCTPDKCLVEKQRLTISFDVSAS